MGRRSTRGIRKSYVEEHLALDDDDEPISVPDDQSKDDDFDAQTEGAVHDVDEDQDEEEEVEQAEPTSDEDGRSDDDGAGKAKDEPAQAKKQRNAGVGMVQSRKNFHEIPHYPLETRIVTRVYAGPLRRYARYSALRDAMYGPEYQRIKIIWDLEIRWTHFPVLPPMLPAEDPQGVIPSPWLPRGFERHHKQRGARWYDTYQTNSPNFQVTRALSPEQAQVFIPEADGDLTTLIGPWDKQKEFRLSQSGGLSLSSSGLPIEDPDSTDQTSNGWMFDVGGIPLAAAWAPTARQDIQVLAIATIPFSDQESTQSEDPSTEAAAKRTGSIQLWEFVADMPENRLASPSRRPPRFLGAHCFDWGRPKRLQFCPVPLDSSGTYGIMAVLCGDGKVRVIDAKYADDADVPFYGSSPPALCSQDSRSDSPQDGSNRPWLPSACWMITAWM
jgi:transcription factor C subunit 6